jgi:predicted DNA repair protein MutK
MPRLLAVISVVGTAAMLWVGGHILLVGVDDLGWHWPYDRVHHWEEGVHHSLSGAAAGVGALLAWCVNTAASLVIGAVWGAVVVAAMHVLPLPRKAAAGH